MKKTNNNGTAKYVIIVIGAFQYYKSAFEENIIAISFMTYELIGLFIDTYAFLLEIPSHSAYDCQLWNDFSFSPKG